MPIVPRCCRFLSPYARARAVVLFGDEPVKQDKGWAGPNMTGKRRMFVTSGPSTSQQHTGGDHDASRRITGEGLSSQPREVSVRSNLLAVQRITVDIA